MSAQTTDLKVNEVTPELFKQGPTPEKMAALKVEQIQILIKQVGLAPTKAKNIKRLSELLIERHEGEIPNTFEELEALPGVGHKTAGVVLAQAFGIPAFPIDTHIHRLAARWGLSNGSNVERTEKDLKAVFPKEAWNDLHLQIIFFGREYCPARFHDLTTCPICSWAATKKRISEEEKRNRPKGRR
jgi:endonuclease-3